MKSNFTMGESSEFNSRLEAIVSSAMDAIIAIDENHNVILFNPSAEIMFGLTSEQALGQSISNFIPPKFRAGHDEHIQRFGSTGVTGRRMGALGAISGIRSNGEEFRVEASISQANVDGERVSTVIMRDISERIASEEVRQLLSREVDHRAKNALAVVQAIISLTTANTKDEFVAAITGRMDALARAHSLLAQNRWEGADLRQIIGDETAAYQMRGRITSEGIDLVVAANAVQPISLLIHELATNAAKYGALSAADGFVAIDWIVLPTGSLELRWTEREGPRVARPHSKGFGSTLIATVAHQLRGEITTDWQVEGLSIVAYLPEATFKIARLVGLPAVSGELSGATKVARARRVLIVEDEMLVAMGLAAGLAGEGWDVMGPVGSVEDAFKSLAGGTAPDVAILDINLDGQNSYPIANVLQTRGIPFLFCSGYETPDREARYQHCPLVRKPTNLKLLVTHLATLIEENLSLPPAAAMH
jgi:PAS domain S-box-containing protein